MDRKKFKVLLSGIIEDAKTAVLATVDKDGRPYMRWMTPTQLPDRPGAIYAVTSPDFAKIVHLADNPKVQWMFQTRLLNRIAYADGLVNIIDNSAMKAEVIQGIGRRLNVFWRVNNDPSKLVVLETVLEKAQYFEPMKGIQENISYS
jgi:general stress protein 26